MQRYRNTYNEIRNAIDISSIEEDKAIRISMVCELSSVNFRTVPNVYCEAILKPSFRVTIETANT